MKKVFTLLALFMCFIVGGYAETVELSKTTVQSSTSTVWTFKQNGVEVKISAPGAIAYGSGNGLDTGMKLSARDYTITIPANFSASSITITGYANDNKKTSYLTYNGEAKTSDVFNSRLNTTSTEKKSYTYDWPSNASSVTIKPNGAQTVAVITITGTVKADMTQLTAPAVTFNADNGLVTISQKESKDVYYTTDGTAPTADKGTKYTGPFTVADGTTVRAIAPGDGTTTINSAEGTAYVLLATVAIEKPVITDVNGTVAITSATPATTIKYSLDGGNTYADYTRPFTLTENKNVKAKASRTGCTDVESDEYSVESVLEKTEGAKTVILNGDNFTMKEGGNWLSTITGNAGTDAEGYTLALSNQSKTYQSATAITVDGASLTTIKSSNGATNKLTLPAGVHVTRMTIYSYVNAATSNTVCGWKDVNGVQEYESIPMGAFTDVADYTTNPDVRVFAIDPTAKEIQFTNTGIQPCFVIALDVVETPTTTISQSGFGTFASSLNCKLPEGLTAYVVAVDEAQTTATLTPVEGSVIPAEQGVVLQGTAGQTYTMGVETAPSVSQADAELFNANALYPVLEDTPNSPENPTDAVYVLICNAQNQAQFALLDKDEVVPAGKAVLWFTDDEAAANTLKIDFSAVTGINAATVKQTATDDAYYTIDGRRLAERPAKGAYIHAGKVYIVK